MPVDEGEFQSLLEQVRELHQLADELTNSSTRFYSSVRARLSWSQETPAIPPDQRELADEIVELLEQPRLSSSQSRQLRREFFGR